MKDNEEKKFVTAIEKAVKKMGKRKNSRKLKMKYTIAQFLSMGGMPWLI